jgi:urease accessory protein
MKIQTSNAFILIAIFTLITRAIAQMCAQAGAHALSPHGFAQGLAHPVSGLDPLAALLAAGLRSAP